MAFASRLARSKGEIAISERGHGTGFFTFSPDARYPQQLASRGYERPTTAQQYWLALHVRAFRQMTGMPPHRWLSMQRVKRAKGLLSGTKMPITEIALTCGFADQSHLTRVFSKVFSHHAGRLATAVEWLMRSQSQTFANEGLSDLSEL